MKLDKQVKKSVKKESAKKQNTKKQKKAFTLIELLAVIIILGILMIIAVPSVTRYINESRDSSYVSTVKQLISGARNLVNSGKYEMYDTDATYYIDTRCIKTENASRSPYGEFEKSYVLVTYDGKGYTYFWTGVDEQGKGTSNILKSDYLKEDKIKSDVKKEDIIENAGIDGTSKYLLIDENCNKNESKTDVIYVNSTTGTHATARIVNLYNKPYASYGDIVEMMAVLDGFDDCEYDIVWQYSADGANTWTDVTNEYWIRPTSDIYHFKYFLDYTTTTFTWRYVVRNLVRKS